VELLRTPDERFAGLPGWPFTPRYLQSFRALLKFFGRRDQAGGSTGRSLPRPRRTPR